MESITSLVDLMAPTFHHSNDDNSPLHSVHEPNMVVSSPYWNVNEAANLLKSTPDAFSVFSLNSQSIRAKISLLKIFLHELESVDCSFSAICIQESWIDDNSDLSSINLENYKLINQPYRVSSHAGLIIFLRNDYTYKNIISPLYDSWEHLCIEVIKKNGKNVILGNIYRPPPLREPTAALRKFTGEFSDLIQKLCKKNGHLMIVGDYNIDLLKSESDKNICNFLDSVMSFGLLPKITHPTRYSDQHGTDHLIDNAFVKTSLKNNQIFSAILTRKISDHLGYLINLNDPHPVLQNPPHPRYIQLNSQTPDKVQKFTTALLDANLVNSIDCSSHGNPNENYEKFGSILETLRHEHFPPRLVRFNKRKHGKSVWITPGIIESVNFRDQLYKDFKKCAFGSLDFLKLKTNLNTYNKILRKTIRNAKKFHYSSLFTECKNDLKKTWKSINSILNRNKPISSFPETFIIDGISFQERNIIADKFNNFFIGIGEKLASQMNPTGLDVDFNTFLTDRPMCTFNFEATNEDFVSRCVDNLQSKSSCGHDLISTKLFKACKSALCTPLTIIINQSLLSGIFPDLLKIAKVIPIFKKGKNDLIDNYRPISLLPAISKVFEKVMYHQVFDYFSSNNLFYPSQYGFRKNHSTEHASLELVDRILQSMENDDTPFSIFIDLSKAFDTLNHEILLKKLSFYGLGATSLNLFKSYLSNRKQYVSLDNIVSDFGKITTGVPQGSILGPLLFIIYINDISNSTSLLNVISYADDTTLTGTIKAFGGNTPELSQNVNKELLKVQNWLLVNKLALNVDKTKLMIFHKPNKKLPNLSLAINDTHIEKVSTFTFLGLTIDENVTWKAHIHKVGRKIAKVFGVMCRLRQFIPSYILLLIYNALVLPHINYSLIVWGFGHTDRIYKLQKKIVRIVSQAKRRSHAMPLFFSLKLLTIDDIFLRLQFKFYFSLKHNSLPIYLNNFSLCRHEDVHHHNTRHKSDVQPASLGKKYTLHRIRFGLVNILRHTSNTNSNSKYFNDLFDSANTTNINKPKELVQAILDKVDTHSLSGYCNYIKIKFISLYGNFTCNDSSCFSCGSH